MTSSILEMEPSDWPITKTDRTRERIEIESWFWARWKALLFLFPTVYNTCTQNLYFKISKFGHVTDDVIMTSCDEKFSKKF